MNSHRPTLGSQFARHGNNFDAIRLVGALLVLFSHAWVLTGNPEAEPIAIAINGYTDGGGLAVSVFFALSGFLIARSATHSPSSAYIRSRLLRLYPALAALLLVQTFLLGPAMTTLPFVTYMADAGTWSALLRGLLLSPPLGLPGLFADNPVPAAVNGSLWTLRIEALCYVGLLVLARMQLLRPHRIAVLGIAFATLLAATVLARAGALPPDFSSVKVIAILGCLAHFVAGAMLFVLRDVIPHRIDFALAGVVVLWLGRNTVAATASFCIVLPYIVIWLALSRPIGRLWLGLVGDISFGIYLYAFPIQQAVVAIAGPLEPLRLVALSAPPTLACAALSRKFVETPSLRLKRR